MVMHHRNGNFVILVSSTFNKFASPYRSMDNFLYIIINGELCWDILAKYVLSLRGV